MKSITLAQAFAILTDCAAIVANNDPGALLYPGMSDLTDEPDNEFMYLSWEDDDGVEWSIRFREGENQTVKVNGGSMWLVDHEGEESHISILVPAELT